MIATHHWPKVIALDPKQAVQEDMFHRKSAKRQRQRAHTVMGSINNRYGNLTLASARLLDRSKMPDVIALSWKPSGHRKTV